MTRARILVVEDEAIVAMDLRDRLTKLDYDVVGVESSGEAAVAQATALRPALVLMDIRLRGAMDGIAAADEIRKRCKIPVVFLTAHSDEATLQRAKVTEPFGYVLKPFEAREIETAIEMAIYKHAAEAKVRALEAQIRHKEKMDAVGQLAGGTAHHFNNLLTVVIARSNLLLSRPDQSSAVREDAEEILKAGQRAASLVRQLLAFSQKQAQRHEAINLNDVMGDLSTFLESLATGGDPSKSAVRTPPREEITVSRKLDPFLSCVTADRGQVGSVLLELAVNASEAMPHGGTLTIETANIDVDDAFVRAHPGVAEGAHVVLTVSDTGHGMDPETMSHLFEPFFTTKGVGQGAGLGLATVHGIVRQSGGQIVVESDIGKGTSFRVYLPRAARPAVAAPALAEPKAPSKLPSESILVVDDEDSVRDVIDSILSGAGYKVLEASAGVEALRVAAGHGDPIHLMLTDVVMPGMNGRELAQRMAAVRPATKVLFISGYGNQKLVEQGILDDGMAVLVKPFSKTSLLHSVREQLDRLA